MVIVVICGTPGSGKSTLINRLKLVEDLSTANFINISEFAVQNTCTLGYDDKLETHIIDEDKLDEALQSEFESKLGPHFVESIHSDMVDPDLVDVVYVCRSSTTNIYDRLKMRNYNENKISNNVDAEIFQTILDEARETYGQHTEVVELRCDTLEELEKNVDLIKQRTMKLLNAK